MKKDLNINKRVRGYCINCGKRTSHKHEDEWSCLECVMALEDKLNDDIFNSENNPFVKARGLSDCSVGINVVNEKKLKKIDLIGFGDWHYGENSCNREAIKKQIDWIKSNPYARVILMGDLLNCATRTSVGAGPYDENMNSQEQYEKVLELLQPIKDKIYGIHIGNHEQRIKNDTSLNLIKLLSKTLKVKYLGYAAFHKIKVGKINYTIYSTHGSSGATLPYTKIKKCISLSSSFDADVYLMGHVHSVQVLPMEYEKVDFKNKQVVRTKKYFVLTGHYLGYHDSYAEMKNILPDKQGCARVRLNGEKKDVHVSV